ncbi:hypothetical protein EBU99_13920, partial [bacterium]|nr:hypothetical protein [bacterium]
SIHDCRITSHVSHKQTQWLLELTDIGMALLLMVTLNLNTAIGVCFKNTYTLGQMCVTVLGCGHIHLDDLFLVFVSLPQRIVLAAVLQKTLASFKITLLVRTCVLTMASTLCVGRVRPRSMLLQATRRMASLLMMPMRLIPSTRTRMRTQMRMSLRTSWSRTQMMRLRLYMSFSMCVSLKYSSMRGHTGVGRLGWVAGWVA